jgi:glycosyltransferase involved in cell wall biosynthesis
MKIIMNNNHISILMPIYNGIEFLNESLPTVLYQTYKNWELIIGINGHTKNSTTFIEANKYKSDKIKILDLFNIKGKSDALNEMIKYTTFDWIALLDVDDKWLPKKLEEQIKLIENYDVIGTPCKYFGDLNIIPKIPIGDISNENFLRVNPIINSSVLIKKELCFWDNKWDGVEDYDLWLKLYFNNKKFYNLNSVNVLHRIHRNSAFNSNGNNLLVKNLLEKYSNYHKKKYC